MSLNTAAIENLEFPNNIFENVSISPKYGNQNLPHIPGQGFNPAGHSSNKSKGGGRHRTIQAHFAKNHPDGRISAGAIIQT
jgi:hypothetical protein